MAVFSHTYMIVLPPCGQHYLKIVWYGGKLLNTHYIPWAAVFFFQR
jgi:hypothetical protein